MKVYFHAPRIKQWKYLTPQNFGLGQSQIRIQRIYHRCTYQHWILNTCVHKLWDKTLFKIGSCNCLISPRKETFNASWRGLMIKHHFPTLLVMSFFKGRLDLNLFPTSFSVFGFQSLVDLRTFSTPFVTSPFPQFRNFLTLMFLDVNLDHHQCLCF